MEAMAQLPPLLFSVLVVLGLGQVVWGTSMTPDQVAECLYKVVVNDRITVGCVGIIIDDNMRAEDRQFLFSTRMALKAHRSPVMVITSQNLIEERSLCLRQRTLLVGPRRSPLVDALLEKFTNSSKSWQFIKWLLIYPSTSNDIKNKSEWLEEQFPMDITYDTSIFIILEMELLEIFRYKQNSPLSINVLGQFLINEAKFVWNINNSINLEGAILKIAVKNSTMSRIELKNNTVIMSSGVYTRVWRIIESRLNFTSEIIVTDRHGWFKNPINGKWPEIESLALEGEVDAIVTKLVPSAEKNKILFLTMPIFSQRYFILVQDPNTNMFIPWDIFTAPFSNSLWAVLGCTILAISLILFLMNFFFGLKAWAKEEVQRYTLPNCLFSIYRVFCNQGQEFDPVSCSSRLIFITTYFSAIIIITSYSGVLISFLTTGRAVLPFGSLAEILADGTYQIGAKINSSIHFQFKNTEDSMMEKIYTNLISKDPKNLFEEYEGGLERVCSTKFALIVSLTSFKYVKQHPCKILNLKPKYLDRPVVIGFSRNFRFFSLFSSIMDDLKSHGIFSKLNRESLQVYNLMDFRVEAPSVDITQVAPLLLQLLVAICLSFIFLLFELLFKFRTTKAQISFLALYPLSAEIKVKRKNVSQQMEEMIDNLKNK